MKKPFCHGAVYRELSIVYLLLVLPIFLSACSSSESMPAATFSPPPFEGASRDTVTTRSPSAMEALSRGLAAITPPGAVLKDIYFEFDSTNLLPDAKEILMKNAEWMKDNPSARVEVEGHCDDIGAAE
jgi:peptidoglycan-associated lipoprotein